MIKIRKSTTFQGQGPISFWMVIFVTELLMHKVFHSHTYLNNSSFGPSTGTTTFFILNQGRWFECLLHFIYCPVCVLNPVEKFYNLQINLPRNKQDRESYNVENIWMYKSYLHQVSKLFCGYLYPPQCFPKICVRVQHYQSMCISDSEPVDKGSFIYWFWSD